ncbi:kinesin heavy chain [Acrasis kona]|uniref:Kinesin-like protein n=1 Tax=Acrasis kona TaxID=1008807 RepID=A0AAW2Z4J4_9EUKA
MTRTNIEVVCRFRPQNELEKKVSGSECVSINNPTCTVVSEGKPNEFTFDAVFGQDSTQAEIFDRVGKPVVENLFKGFNGTIFAYGQTGSGKSYTMMGGPNNKGIIPNVVDDLFEQVKIGEESVEFTVTVQYVEIYNEKIRDLFDVDQTNLQIKEDYTSGRGMYVQDATEEKVDCADKVFDLMKKGTANRAVGSTRMNADSSRSHSIFIMTVNQKHKVSMDTKSGKLFLVDLAGSEKVKKTGAAGTRLEEAKTINKSLSCLGNVINALTDGKSKFVPYRDSKLTRLLQDSLGGNSLTTLVLNASPSVYNDVETISTLRFGIRAKSIKNKPRVNEVLSAVELMKMLEAARVSIAQLEEEVRCLRSGGKPPLKNTGGAIKRSPSNPEISQLDSLGEIPAINKQQLIESMLQEISELKEKCVALEEAIKVHCERIDKLTEENESLTEKAEELESRIAQHQVVEQEMQGQIENLRNVQNENATLAGQIETLRLQGVNKDKEITELKQSLRWERDSIEDKVAQIHKLERELRNKNQEKERIEERRRKMATLVERFQREIKYLEQDDKQWENSDEETTDRVNNAVVVSPNDS